MDGGMNKCVIHLLQQLGLNNVIRELVHSLFYLYHVEAVIGIRGGFNGFLGKLTIVRVHSYILDDDDDDCDCDDVCDDFCHDDCDDDCYDDFDDNYDDDDDGGGDDDDDCDHEIDCDDDDDCDDVCDDDD